jgi:hypothetical protein
VSDACMRAYPDTRAPEGMARIASSIPRAPTWPNRAATTTATSPPSSNPHASQRESTTPTVAPGQRRVRACAPWRREAAPPSSASPLFGLSPERVAARASEPGFCTLLSVSPARTTKNTRAPAPPCLRAAAVKRHLVCGQQGTVLGLEINSRAEIRRCCVRKQSIRPQAEQDGHQDNRRLPPRVASPRVSESRSTQGTPASARKSAPLSGTASAPAVSAHEASSGRAAGRARGTKAGAVAPRSTQCSRECSSSRPTAHTGTNRALLLAAGRLRAKRRRGHRRHRSEPAGAAGHQTGHRDAGARARGHAGSSAGAARARGAREPPPRAQRQDAALSGLAWPRRATGVEALFHSAPGASTCPASACTALQGASAQKQARAPGCPRPWVAVEFDSLF